MYQIYFFTDEESDDGSGSEGSGSEEADVCYEVLQGSMILTPSNTKIFLDGEWTDANDCFSQVKAAADADVYIAEFYNDIELNPPQQE